VFQTQCKLKSSLVEPEDWSDCCYFVFWAFGVFFGDSIKGGNGARGSRGGQGARHSREIGVIGTDSYTAQYFCSAALLQQ
jgi:hypothetical protein